MIVSWIKGIALHRSRQLFLSAAGIAVATALIGVIGVFATSSSQTMTRRAVASVPVDWQIALGNAADPATLKQILSKSATVTAVETVGYADVAGFEARTDATTQTTGAGQVLGIGADYVKTFPGQIRLLAGAVDGALIAQQTAANLHVSIGDTVAILRDGKTPASVKIAGVVDLPNANAMFQTIGPQKGPTPTAPPDNILLLPMDTWTSLFSTAMPGGTARLQIHASLDHSNLPAAPEAAYLDITGRARNFEVRAAGVAQVGDNLSARLGAVRQDALFAQILLLFLGLPGVVLAMLLTIAIVRADAARRRREQALLSLRGASLGQIARLVVVDGGLVAIAGCVSGTLLAALLSTIVLSVDLQSAAVVQWLAITLGVGVVLALTSILTPTLIDLREHTVVSRRAALALVSKPLWQKTYLDLVLLALAGIVFWRVANTGYQVVLAPEGVAATSVDYTAFLAPLCLWIGAGLLVLRIGGSALAVGRNVLTRLLRPISRHLADPVATSLSRHSGRIAGGIALATLAFSFATAVAVFDTTYNAQLLVDAQLTNGADITVTGTSASPAGDRLQDIRQVPDVVAVEAMQHRFAYVGNDLQDLYGIDPGTIGHATTIADAYFGNRDAHATLNRLAKTPDGLLVSQETVNDFQLSVGDLVKLRLLNAADNQYRTIAFHFIGVVTEFPTAPHDSFLVANASYVAAQTGNSHSEVVLVRSRGDPGAVALAIGGILGKESPLKVTDLSQAARLIGSTLTAVDLRKLTAIELSFAVLLVAGATGLVLSLGFAERRRAATILSALGATSADIRKFAQAEAAIILVAGAVCGFILGESVAFLLVKVLTGVFDPPPDELFQPWIYLLIVAAGAALTTIIAVWRSSIRLINARL
ncbi:MAG: ABC transporter permease [Bradyrhizobiaceae bacterium]|nr:MAG: ABC transporter permease [Bradyrhizobiaceae bacterium]